MKRKSFGDNIIQDQINTNATQEFLQGQKIYPLSAVGTTTSDNEKIESWVQDLKQVLLNLPVMVEKMGEVISFEKLNNTLMNLEAFSKELHSESLDLFKTSFQRSILPLTIQSEFCRYCYEKPRGYAGDFVMMEMIWNGRAQPEKFRYRGTSPLGKLLNAFTLDSANCKANEERVYILKRFFSMFPSGSKIASVGSGSCIEIAEFLKENPRVELEIHLLDQDQGAMEFAVQKLQPFKAKIVCHHGHILKSILKLEDTYYDGIYSSGLYDYFDMKSCTKITEKLWSSLKPKGTLCVINANPSNPTRFWMEYVSNWILSYKKLNEYLLLGQNLTFINNIVLKKDNQGIYQYYYLNKEG